MAKEVKRPAASATDKVMPTGKPRDAVKKISRTTDATPADEVVEDEVPEGASTDTTTKDAKGATDAKAKAPKKTSGRVTPKKPAASARYTPPTAKFEEMPSPIWVPILMFTLFALGMLTIFLNYVGLLPNATSNWYLLLGLGFILGGIITATQYR